MSNPEYMLRPASFADAATITRFNVALAQESEGLELAAETVAAGVAAFLADPAKGFYVVAERAGQVVAQLGITFEWSDWRNGYFWWIQSVYVAPEARRGGLFRALYQHVENLARTRPDVIGLRLYVDGTNTSAQETYLALGLARESYILMGRSLVPEA